MAILKNTSISSTGSLQLPSGTTAERLSPQSAQLRYNSTVNRIEAYNANLANWVDVAYLNVAATGGNSVYNIDTDGTTYRVHVFTTVGNSTFTVTNGGQIEYLIVAGGGGGGASRGGGTAGGGGGAGGLLTGFTTVTSQAYTITVGAGGSPGGINNNGVAPLAGGNSVAFGLTAVGGGRAGTYALNEGGVGGSGGGGAYTGGSGGVSFGAGTTDQGNAGGNGNAGANQPGGGGGGAGSIGGTATATISGAGGVGISSNITGIITSYAGGGGGGLYAGGGTASGGGFGGGGDGGGLSIGVAATAGTPNSGGGGGGVGGPPDTGLPGAGGSGIVVVRYPIRQKGLGVSVQTVNDTSLLVSFDFASPNSYPGTGNVIYGSNTNPRSGILINSPTVRDFRTHRSSFRFNGSNQYINAGNLELRRNWTMEMWARRNGDVDFSAFGHGPATTNQGLHIVYQTGARGMVFGLNGNDNDYQNNYRPAGGIWQHWVFTYNHSTFVKQFYANGVLQTPGASVQNQYAGTGQFNIGAIYSTALGFANGEIAVANVYSRILSVTEIQNNFTANRWRFGV